MTARRVLADLKRAVRPDKAEFLPGFFQAYPGGYGEGDRFLGVVVPDQRKIAREYRDLDTNQIQKLLDSPWHEARLTALYILVLQFEKAHRGKHADETQAKRIVDFYLDNLTAVNNWDLVDSSAPKILGPWLVDHPKQRKLLRKLASSKVLWRRRVAVLATYALIRDDEYDEILDLAEFLMGDDQDLMHKAIGWMLREVWKREPGLVESFLDQHVTAMPRTMLRYTIEKMPKASRLAWLE